MRPLPAEAEALIKGFEKLVLRVYDDKRPKKILKPGDEALGVLTAGWGATGGLKIGMTITRQWAQDRFESDTQNKAIKPLYRKIGADIVDQLSDGQYGALLSFVFNLGTGDPAKPEWGIWKRLRKREWAQVAGEIQRFINWDGKPSNGLIRRRAAEVAMWNAGLPEAEPTAPPSSVTRREPTPPTPVSATPAHASPMLLSTATSALGAVGMGGKAVYDAVQPFSKDSPVVENMTATIAVFLAVVAALAALLVFLKKRRERT